MELTSNFLFVVDFIVHVDNLSNTSSSGKSASSFYGRNSGLFSFERLVLLFYSHNFFSQKYILVGGN